MYLVEYFVLRWDLASNENMKYKVTIVLISKTNQLRKLHL